jgi:hypothetical protein
VKGAALGVSVGLLALSLAAEARAEALDGKAPLVCDFTEAAQCDGAAVCRDVTLEQIDLPPVIHVDFAASTLASEDGQRTSPIGAVEALDTALVLQGHQNGRGWTLVIDRATGQLSATLAEAEGALVVAGACTAR